MKRKQAYRGMLRPLVFKRTGLPIAFLFLILSTVTHAQAPQSTHSYVIRGKVVSAEDDSPLPGATVQVKGSFAGASTDENGSFTLTTNINPIIISFSYLGYSALDTTLTLPLLNSLIVKLKQDAGMLDEVIVSTGYERVPRARAPGSFVVIDSALLQRRVSTGILERLDGVVSGLIFNRNQPGQANNSDISIRGRSTIFANPDPLIILDNFPYEGDLDNINPNDIETISVLKDAAAASIWGVRAGNGVIVITSKKGRSNVKPFVRFNANLTIGNKPDLFYSPQLTPEEYISVEEFLFNNGRFNGQIGDGYSALTPAVEIFLRRRNGEITAADSSAMINNLLRTDVREQLENNLYRMSASQQYAVNISGGGEFNKYYVSAGVDKNLHNIRSDSYNRLTLNANNSYSFLENKLTWSNGIIFTNNRRVNNPAAYVYPFTPYDQLVDENGDPQAVYQNFRKSYLDTAGAGQLLDWTYAPLQEIETERRTSDLLDYRITTDLHYEIFKGLQGSAYYLFQKGVTEVEHSRPLKSYYTRNLINQYTQLDYNTGDIVRPVPIGDILNKSKNAYTVQTGRLQLNFNQEWGAAHEITAIAGFEVNENKASGTSYRLYGYDPNTGDNANESINYALNYPHFYGTGRGRISPGTTSSGSLNRNRSYYLNASYNYKRKYTISVSGRRDASNIFGVSSNQKGVPLWSAGFSWRIDNEHFYSLEWLHNLKFRATYGVNGNLDNGTTAYLTSRIGSRNPFNMPYQRLMNPPNPSLRWEKVTVLNLGIDFRLSNDFLSGSIEYYSKKSDDLIANAPVAHQTGFSEFRGNVANMETEGIDLVFNLLVPGKGVKWYASLLFSYAEDKITHYHTAQSSNRDVVTSNYTNPLEGYPYYAIFSYPSAGLDNTGNPQGFLNGELSKDYIGIVVATDPTSLKYHGPGTPLFFGSFMNRVNLGNFSISANLLYKLGHYYRRPSINYSALFNGTYQQGDFSNRWKRPGDELRTDVPAMIYPANVGRALFYTNSETLLEKADHIRLQDVRISYLYWGSLAKGLPFKSLEVYLYANNIGILWRASKKSIDPDYPISPPQTRSVSLGVQASF